MTQTYLTLVAESDVSERDRLVMLNAIFRPLPGAQVEAVAPPTILDLLKKGDWPKFVLIPPIGGSQQPGARSMIERALRDYLAKVGRGHRHRVVGVWSGSNESSTALR